MICGVTPIELKDVKDVVDSFDKPFVLIGDFEADSLDPTLIHVGAFFAYPQGKWFVFHQQEQCTGPEVKYLLDKCTYLCGHNFVSFDLRKIIHRFIDPKFKVTKIRDTLILSRMLRYDRVGGHGLESWGEYFGIKKPPIDDWSTYTPEMVERVIEDVKINVRLFEKLKREFKSPQESVLLEQEVQWWLDEMQEYGFWFNLPKADELYSRVCKEEQTLLDQLRKDFGKKSKPTLTTKVYDKKIIKKFVNEDGTPVKVLNENNRWVNKVETTFVKAHRSKKHIEPKTLWGDFSFLEWEEFNPGSPQQVQEKLDKCGWRPTVFRKPSKIMLSKGIKQGSPIVSDEENLRTIPEDAPDSIKNIGHYLVVRNRKLRMEEWFQHLKEDQRMHGSMTGIGARTHRCSHSRPNNGNIPSKDGYLGPEYRSVWGVPPVTIIKKGTYDNIYLTHEERVQIGCDASGIQLRILCHYLDDPEYTKQVVSGDIHSYNMFAAGINPGSCEVKEDKVMKKLGYLPTLQEAVKNRFGKEEGFEWEGRSVAKTMIYAYLLGGGNQKLQSITGIPGQVLKDKFYREIPALGHLQEVIIPEAITKGYIHGLDGRVFSLDDVPKHKVLSILLQEGEAVIMKKALCKIARYIRTKRIDAFPVAFVHDEFQIDCCLSRSKEIAEVTRQAIIQSGVELGLRCPLDAEYRIGKDWFDCH